MVFGLGKRKIEIDLDKTQYFPGESISGKIILGFRKPIQARVLRVGFFAVKLIIYPNGRRGEPIMYKSELVLGGEGEYYENIYSLSLKIPENIFEIAKNWWDNKEYASPDGSVIRKVESMTNDYLRKRSTDEFFVEAIIEIPHSLDNIIRSRKTINLIEK